MHFNFSIGAALRKKDDETGTITYALLAFLFVLGG